MSSILSAFLLQPSLGGTHGRGLHRIFGTGLAAVWSYFTLALSYAASGTTWDDNAGKWIVAGLLTAIWGALCATNCVRYRDLNYMWRVAGFTVPLVGLSLIRTSEPQWAHTGWRFLNVCIGVVIVVLVGLTVFPLSARRIANANFEAGLATLAALIRQLPLHVSLKYI